MPITSTTQKVADAINQMVAALKEEYKTDFSYTVFGRGMILAQSNMNGVNQPVPMVNPPKRTKVLGHDDNPGKKLNR